jgi:hypothetical protein
VVAALTNDALVHEAPAIVGCKTPSALAHATGSDRSSEVAKWRVRLAGWSVAIWVFIAANDFAISRKRRG